MGVIDRLITSKSWTVKKKVDKRINQNVNSIKIMANNNKNSPKNSSPASASFFTFETGGNSTTTSSTSSPSTSKNPKVPKTPLLSPRFWNSAEQKRELQKQQSIKELDDEIERVRRNLWIQNVEEETEEDFHMKNNEIRQYIDEKSQNEDFQRTVKILQDWVNEMLIDELSIV